VLKSPFERRTHFPSIISIAGTISICIVSLICHIDDFSAAKLQKMPFLSGLLFQNE
jgi:hypothetical protein